MIFSLKASQYLKYGSALLFFLGILLVGFFGHSVLADHTNQYKGNGYAYGAIDDDGDFDADTGIGYLSFGCEDDVGDACEATATENFPTGYGVRINTNAESPDEGKFFGYAWSSNYGWVSFYNNDVSSCGASGGLEIPDDVQNFIHTPGSTITLDGFARVLNYDSAEWNGCIRFGSSDDFGVGSQYRSTLKVVSPSLLELHGWAYGDNVVGWISFDCANCGVSFNPIEEECPEADDSEECAPEGPSAGLALYVGGDQDTPPQIVGNSNYLLLVESVDQSQNVKLIPQAFGQSVESCMADASSNGTGTVSGWDGLLNQPGLNPLEPDDITNQTIATISGYSIGEIFHFTISCVSVDDGSPLSAEAFVILAFPNAIISIDANPNPINLTEDPQGNTILSWNFDNIQDNSCSISGFVDFTPADDADPLTAISPAFAEDIGFSSWSPNSPGNDDLFGIINFPLWFQISCQDFADQTVSDSVYITTKDLGCTGSMEAAGYCSNNINPIFEEF